MNDQHTRINDAAAQAAGTREQAIAAIDAAEKALTWTTSRGTWDPVRDYISGRRGLVKHLQTGDDLAEFVHPADAEHACLWHPRRVKALIDRDRAILDRHKPDPKYSDGACPCGWEGDQCPEANAVIAFWTSDDMPDITPNPEPRRQMLNGDMRHQVMLLSNHARLRAEDPQPAPGESKNVVIPATAQAEAYTDMAVRLEAVRTLAIGPHSNNPRFAEIGLDVLVDVARYARARYETPITYTRDEQALAHSGRCKAYRDMAERLEALLTGDQS